MEDVGLSQEGNYVVYVGTGRDKSIKWGETAAPPVI